MKYRIMAACENNGEYLIIPALAGFFDTRTDASLQMELLEKSHKQTKFYIVEDKR